MFASWLHDVMSVVQSSFFARNLATPPSSTSDPVKTDETVPENEFDHATGMEKCVFNIYFALFRLLRQSLGLHEEAVFYSLEYKPACNQNTE